MDKPNYHQLLFEGYTKAFPNKRKQDCQKDVTEIWNKLKKEDNVPTKVDSLIKSYAAIAQKNKGKLMSWAGQDEDAFPCKSATNVIIEQEAVNYQTNKQDQNALDLEAGPSGEAKSVKYKTKAQDELQGQINVLNSDLIGLYKRKDSSVLSLDQENELKEKKLKVDELEKNLKRKRYDQEKQQIFRKKKKEALAQLCAENPDICNKLKIRQKHGRPTTEDQPLLLKAIIDIALYGSAAHQKRQSDIYHSVRTLDELTEQLKAEGFHISRSAVYTRLIPKRSLSLEGKRHITTVPVKLIRAQNDAHSKHIDGRFCTATLTHLEEVASMLGPREVCFISQDDKARVPIGLTAANKQAPLLMHVEYRITLPDHDWVVAARHKLIPSVYAGIEIQKDGQGKPEAVTYSGPTYIAIRSGKHCSSSAYAHGLDYERLLELEEFDSLTKDPSNKLVKPVLIMSVGGGPDENPRYQKVIDVAIHHFVKQNLDAFFIATNAPGRSAFNRVERRMAPLSRELSGLILPHEHFGSHLDSLGRTIDDELEKSNFKYAGETLSEVWRQVTIDNFPTVAEYIMPEVSELEAENLLTKDQDWCSNHVRTSQYFLQIVKCHNVNCCQPIRSSYFEIIHDRFFRPPIPVCQTSEGLKAPDASESDLHRFPSLFFNQSMRVDNMLPRSTKAFKILPYDLFCPSIQLSLLERICKICNLYVASQVMLKKHVQQHRQHDLGPRQLPRAPQPQRIQPVRVAAKRQRELMTIIAHGEMLSAEWLDEDDIDLSGVSVPQENIESATMPIIAIEEHLASPWEDE
ncbi:hypothetical protein BsWGS_08300 [Bradybaena similaris]